MNETMLCGAGDFRDASFVPGAKGTGIVDATAPASAEEAREGDSEEAGELSSMDAMDAMDAEADVAGVSTAGRVFLRLCLGAGG